jgi:hypothetical protein
MSDKKYAIVKSITTFYHAYAVPMDQIQAMNTDSDADPSWLSDMVTTEEVEEIGQIYLGEQIIGSEVVNEDEMLKIFDQVAPYLSSWDRERKITFVEGLLGRHK